MSYLVVFFTMVCTGGVVYYWFEFRKFKHQLLQVNKQWQQYQTEQTTLVNADLVFAKQLAEINRQLISMDHQLQELSNKRDNDGAYQHALRILQMGGEKQEIIDSCHLSNAEAELLINLQAYRQAMRVD